MKLEWDEQGRYLDADRPSDTWWVITTTEPGGAPGACEELDGLARDKRQASLVARAALERDYVPGLKVHRITLA